jgi:hypothetical protein
MDNSHLEMKVTAAGKILHMTTDTLTWNSQHIVTVQNIASADSLGVIKVGSGLTIAEDGTLSVSSNMTITHHTSTDDLIGRFCETTGVIYDGYDKVTSKDCITKQKLSTELNNKILGIITDKNEFASHGDVLVAVDKGEYQLGDLLVPTETGARVATNDEKLIIMVNGLPRVRITAITDPRIPEGFVACFLS